MTSIESVAQSTSPLDTGRLNYAERLTDIAFLLLAVKTIAPESVALIGAFGASLMVLAAYALSRPRIHRISLSVIAFLCLATGALLYSPVAGLQALAVFLPTGLMAIAAFRPNIRLAALLRSILRAATAQCILTIGVAGTELVRTGTISRPDAVGLLTSPFPMCGLVICVVLPMFGSELRPATKRTLFRILLLCFLTLVITQTRGMFVGAILAVAVTALIRGRRAFRKTVIRLLPLGLLLLGFVFAVGQVTSGLIDRMFGEGFGASADGRNVELEESWRLIRSGPFFGHGVGFSFDNPIAAGNDQIVYVHNSVMYFGLMGGYPLMLAYLVIIAMLLRAVGRAHNSSEIAIVAMTLSVFTFSLTSAIQREATFSLLVALGIAAAGVIERQQQVGRSTFIRTHEAVLMYDHGCRELVSSKTLEVGPNLETSKGTSDGK